MLPNRHGVTLLELLIALTVLMTLVGISFVALGPRFDEQRFNAGADAVMQHCLLARAEAQLSGRPVEIVYLPESNRLAARYFDPERSAEALREDGAAVLPENFEPDAMGDEEESATIFAGWATHWLPEHVRLTAEAPEDLLDGAGIDDEWAEFEAAQDAFEYEWGEEAESDAEPFRLVVYLPDGTALLAGGAWLVDRDGRLAECTINRFTGLPTVQRIKRAIDVELEDPYDEAEDDVEDESLVEEIEELIEESGSADESAGTFSDGGADASAGEDGS
jgi:hypothetical protein